MSECINLREVYGKRYKIEAECGPLTTRTDPWLMIIPGKLGHIYPHGGELLGVATDSRIGVRPLKAVPGLSVTQDGDGINATFPQPEFTAVAKIIHAKKRPSQRQVDQRRKAGLSTRFKKHGVEVGFSAP